MRYTLCYTVTLFGTKKERVDTTLFCDSITMVFNDLTASAAAGIVVDW